MRSPRRLLSRIRRSLSDPTPTPVPSASPVPTDEVTYAPQSDGEADPGEVVWGWVPYEEDATQGKDRPVLVIGRRRAAGHEQGHEQLLGLMLTSKDHDRDAEDEARHGRHWMDVGTGGWDREGRPSEVRLDRLIVLEHADVRREGAALDRTTFDAVVGASRDFHSLP